MGNRYVFPFPIQGRNKRPLSCRVRARSVFSVCSVNFFEFGLLRRRARDGGVEPAAGGLSGADVQRSRRYGGGDRRSAHL